MELPKQVCEPLQCDARENVCTSSDQSSPERNDLVASRAEDDDSMVQSGSGVLLFPAPRPPSEQAQVPQPEPGLKCPRCDSTNTKFCYFNNHSLTRPRHFCHTCGRYWIRGGALRRVRVGSGFSCHAKRSTKSKASAREPAAAAGTASSALTATTPNTTSCTGTAPPGFNQYSMFCTKSASPHSNWFADNFDPASPGFGSPARLLFPQQVLKGVDIGLQSGSGGDCEDGASSTTE